MRILSGDLEVSKELASKEFLDKPFLENRPELWGTKSKDKVEKWQSDLLKLPEAQSLS